jgi:uncharacterized protein YecE (DUF72 family)
VRDLLTETGMSFCIHDMSGSASPDWLTGPVAYLRYHGPTEVKYAGSYSPAHLRRAAARVREYQESGRDVFVYFNNDVGGHAVENALQLREFVSRRSGLQPDRPVRLQTGPTSFGPCRG